MSLAFIGYGNLNAGIWYLGMEEAGGGEAELRARLAFRRVEDLARAHQLLGVIKHHEGRRNRLPSSRWQPPPHSPRPLPHP